MIEILLATGNPGKKKEMVEAFRELTNITWRSLDEFPEIEDADESGSTFEENALIKAKYFGNITGLLTLAEDAGLTLSAFPEKFGVRTRREIDASNDVEWLRIFLEMMEGKADRVSMFYSAMAFYNPKNGTEFIVEGTTSGKIEEFPQSPIEKGIPVSSVFVPDGFDDVYSAMTKQKKTEVSHRGKAAKKMEEYLRGL